MLASVFPISIFASEPSSVNSDVNLSRTEITDDFKYTFAGAFDVDDYPVKKDDSVHLISLMEGRSSNGNVELFVYLYNPSRKELVKDTSIDKVTLSIFSSENDENKDAYSKKDITLIKTHGATVETGSYTNALLVKYKVEIDSTYNDKVDRYYRIADIEVLLKGSSTASSCLCGKEFKFFNNEAGYINTSVQDLTTLEMDAFHTFYRVDTEGIDEYDDVQSIYFAVSNKLLKQYGGIYAMNVVWESYWTNQGLVIDNENVRNEFYNNWVNSHSDSFKYSVLYNKVFPINAGVYDYYYMGHNVNKLSSYIKWDENTFFNPNENQVGYKWSSSPSIKPIPDVIGPKVDRTLFPISMVFYSDNVTSFEELSVPGEDVIAYLEYENWNSNLFWANWSHNQTFTVELEDKELNIYKKCSGWEKFWHGDYFEKDTGEKITYSAFQSIDLKDLKNLSTEEFSRKYLIDKADVRCEYGDCTCCFSCRVNKEKYEDCTWFMLRYDTTRYRSYDALIVDNETGNAEVCNAHMFETEAIRNFDTISVTLKDTNNDGNAVYTVFPIMRSPTNFASDVWTPSEKPVLDLGINNNDFWNFLELALKIIAFLFVLLVVLKVWDIIKPVFKGLFTVLTKPFKKGKGKK